MRSREQIKLSLVLAFAAILPFVLMVLGAYIVEEHTRDGRLAMWLIVHSQTMTDQQLAHAIGEDPLAVMRRSRMMMKAIDPAVAIIVGCFVALLLRKNTGKVVALVLTPYFLFDFSKMAFAYVQTPARTLIEIAKVLGTNTAYIASAVLVAVALVRLLARRVAGTRPAQ